MRKFGKSLFYSLVFWTPLCANATEVRDVRAVILDPCIAVGAADSVGDLSFTIFYDNTSSGGPTRFRLQFFGRGSRPLNIPRVRVFAAFPVYADGILDVSRFAGKGALGAQAVLNGDAACVNGKPATSGDFRIILTPVN